VIIRRILPGIAALLMLSAGAQAAATRVVYFGTEKTYAGKNDLGEACTVIQNAYYKLCYPAGLEEDGRLIDGYLKNSVTAMVQEFPDQDPENLLKKGINCTVYVYSAENGKVSDANALTVNGEEDGKYIATLYFLAPSKHSPGAADAIGRLKDKKYFSYLVGHEYSGIILDRITRGKSEGWTTYQAPAWFNQGYQQYLGLKYSPIADETFGAYLAKLKRRPRRVHAFSYGVAVKDKDEDGAVLLMFMNEVFGPQKVQAVLTSDRPTFYEALEELIGTKEVFMQAWEKWLKAQPVKP